MNQETIRQQLTDLKMHTAARELEAVLHNEKRTVHLAWLADLLAREVDARKERALQFRIKRADFPEITTLEAFDWSFNPKLNEQAVRELTTLNFVRQQQIALFLGRPGTGKTHLALAIGVIAAQAGLRVFCSSMKRLAAQISKARARNQLDILFRRILSAHLWILDDWAVVSMPSEIAEEVFDLLDRRKHSTALLLTSNRDVSEWAQVFQDPVLAAAALDRLFENAHIVEFNGKSYRLNSKISLKELDLGELKED